MSMHSYDRLYESLEIGKTYRRYSLLHFSKSIDRDLARLVKERKIEKLSGGLYYKPKLSKFGGLPPQDSDLVYSFLNDDRFLIVTWNHYNLLELGLTQLYNKLVVYNLKRHGQFVIGGKLYDFRHPNKGFPEKLSAEFLLVDLLNNLNELAEDIDHIKKQVTRNINNFDKEKTQHHAKNYGKISTKRFLERLLNNQ